MDNCGRCKDRGEEIMSAKRSITKCAIKRTAKKVGVCTFGVILGFALLIVIMSGIGALIIMIVSAFPILHTVFQFVILTGFISLFLFMVIYGIYKEYEWNHRVCEDIESEKKKRDGFQA